MPSARASAARASSGRAAAGARAQPQRRTTRAAPAPPRKVTLRSPHLRLRWERVGRIGLLVVLGIVVALYAARTLSWVHTRSQASAQNVVVTRLERENASLNAQARSLSEPSTIVKDARALGMTRPGEQSYAVTGEPSN